jgi:hypothetical protein
LGTIDIANSHTSKEPNRHRKVRKIFTIVTIANCTDRQFTRSDANQLVK